MSKKKDSVLYILQYLYEQTDDDHGVTNADILAHLKKKGIDFNERSIASAVTSINESFEDTPYIEIISYMENNKKHYKLLDRPLEYTEAEMLSSALDSVKSFSKNDVKNLKSKLYSLLSSHQLEKVVPALSVNKSRQTGNGSMSWNLSVINRAIKEGFKISVGYEKSDEIGYRTISPYKIHTCADGIYVLGKCDQHETDISRFRVDRIKEIELTSQRLIPCNNLSELEDMTTIGKDMSYGEKGTAVLIFTKQIEKVIYDRYGRNVNVTRLPDGRMRISVDEYLTNTFLGWIFSMGEDIEVAGNQTLVNLMKKYVNSWAERLS